ncbi:MAG: winged helix-turn-helix domain-containing protein [Rubrivivax sp.]
MPPRSAGGDALAPWCLEVDLVAHRVRRAEQDVQLTPTEFALLARLVRSAGQVVTHRRLLADVRGAEATEQTQYLRLYMGQLRAKLEDEPAAPNCLLTEPGVGYHIVEADEGEEAHEASATEG